MKEKKKKKNKKQIRVKSMIIRSEQEENERNLLS